MRSETKAKAMKFMTYTSEPETTVVLVFDLKAEAV